MTLNPYIAAGAALGAVLLLGRDPNVKTQYAGAADTAAMAALRAHGPIGGVTFTVPPSNSALDAFVAMRDALIQKNGALTEPSGVKYTGKYPANMTAGQLGDIAAAWLEAGRAANASDADTFPMPTTTLPVFGTTIDTSESSSFAQAYKALDDWRNAITWNVSPGDTEETFDRVLRLAAELDVDYATTGGRPSDQGWTWSNVEGGLGAAATATGSFVAGVAGDAAGKIAGTLLSSSLVWAAGLAYVAWRLYR